MFKANKIYEVNMLKSLDGDLGDCYYSLIEVINGSYLFHIDLIYGGIGCCDDGCGTVSRILTTNINDAIKIINSDVVVKSEISIQFKNKKNEYEILKINKIFYLKFDNRNLYKVNCGDDSILMIGLDENNSIPVNNFKLIYERGKNNYWRK